MSPRRRMPNPKPRTRAELVMQLKREAHPVGAKLDSIDRLLKIIGNRADRAAQRARAHPTGSVIGSVVQVPQSDPATEQAWDYLDLVDRALWALQTDDADAIDRAIQVLPRVPRG